MKTDYIKINKTSLIFKNYQISDVSMKVKDISNLGTLSVNISFDAQIDTEQKEFTTFIKTSLADDNKNIKLSLITNAYFGYECDEEEELKYLLAMNSTHMVFPYIRAFITNITALSGIPPLIMPTYNTREMGEAFLEKVEQKGIKSYYKNKE